MKNKPNTVNEYSSKYGKCSYDIHPLEFSESMPAVCCTALLAYVPFPLSPYITVIDVY
jgi:hypothetical protein